MKSLTKAGWLIVLRSWCCLWLNLLSSLGSPYVLGQCPPLHPWLWLNHPHSGSPLLCYFTSWFHHLCSSLVLIFGCHMVPNRELSLLEPRPWSFCSFSAHWHPKPTRITLSGFHIKAPLSHPWLYPTFPYRGVYPFGISGPHWRKKSCLGLHIKYTNTNESWEAKTGFK